MAIKELYLEIPINISMHKGKPCVIIHKSLTDPIILRALVMSALDKRPITIKLFFHKPHLQISNCIQKGILHTNSKGEYTFTDY